MTDEGRSRELRAALSGAVATLAMTLLMATGLGWAPGLDGHMHPFPRLVAAGLLRQTHGTGPVLLGLILHFLYGTVAGMVFAYFARPMTRAKGIGYGLWLWFVMQILVLPWLHFSEFGLVHGRTGLAFGTLILHLFYGGILGYLGARDEVKHQATFDDLGRLQRPPGGGRELVT